MKLPTVRRLFLTSAMGLLMGPATSLFLLAATPQLSISHPPGNTIQISWPGELGKTYQLQTSTGLGPWMDHGAPVAGLNGTITVNVSLTGIPRAFFRLKPPPPDVVSAVFVPGSGVLTVTGGNQDSLITASRDAAGKILVNGGAVTITGGTPTVANTTRIDLFGREGDDDLRLEETQGALPAARLFGEGGHDILTGGSGADVLDGGPGNDTLSGKGGTDSLTGGDGDDVLTGGDADDQVSGGPNNDRLIWNPGDDSDLNEGDDGTDTIEVQGGNGDEMFTATANGLRVRFDRINPAPFALDIGTSEKLVLNANGGGDSFSATGNLAALIQITVDGGAGADTLLGSNGADLLIGGSEADTIDGQQGNDVIFLGDGDDTALWDPGDGSDTIEGQAGNDTLAFHGANISEIFDLRANGSRTRFFRNVANVIMDLNDVEILDLDTLGGADSLTVDDLTGTDIHTVIADLASTLGGTAGDAAADTITVNGTSGPDAFSITAAAPNVTVTGPAVSVRILHPEAANDRVTLNGLAGADSFSVGANVSSLIAVTTNQ